MDPVVDAASFDSLVVAPGSGRRAAALALHAMLPADRTWVMQRLAPGDRAAMDSLLGELADLGVSQGTDLARQALAARSSAPSKTRVTDDARDRRIAAAPAARVAEVLAEEPTALVERVFALRPWPWRSAVVEALRARGIAVHGEKPGVEAPSSTRSSTAKALDRGLIDLLANRLAEASFVGDAAPRFVDARFASLASGWRALIRRLRRP